MSKANIQDLLKKINYIEADIEIQKQILFSIPSNQRDEMEKTVGIIAKKNEEIKTLRAQIKEIDPAEFERITVFEQAISKFKEVASEKQFESIVSKNVNEECSLTLVTGEKIECLLKGYSKEGNWTIITMEGELMSFAEKEVKDNPPPPPDNPGFNA